MCKIDTIPKKETKIKYTKVHQENKLLINYRASDFQVNYNISLIFANQNPELIASHMNYHEILTNHNH